MKFSYLFIALILAACASDNTSITYPNQHRVTNPLGNPTNPTRPFENSIGTYNAKYTGMISRTENQISDYIKYRLNNWDLYHPNVGKNISRTDIANAAVWLTGAQWTEAEIKQHFAGNSTLMQMAMWVVDNRLHSCISGDNPEKCFVKWRTVNADYYNNIADEIRKNTTPLSAANATFMATNDAKIKFIVDTDGRINGATVTENGTDTKYEIFTHVHSDDDYVMLDKLSYDSAGKELGLSYSDFGTYSIQRDKIDRQTEEETSETILSDIPFAGGYASQKIDPGKITTGLHFAGRAVGTAQDSKNIVDLDGTANLNFDKNTGTSLLSASFKDWYDIYVKDDGTISFTNYTNKNDLVKLGAAPNDNGIITATGAQMNVGYYGPAPDTSIPTEATGTVQYTENTSGVKMDIAFGVK